jgi:hypothetical protein
MYVHYLLGLGGWVGAPDDDEAPPLAAVANPPVDLAQPAREPRPGCAWARRARRCCWRGAPELRA